MADVTVRKFEAAEACLLAALRLYFEDEHIAAVHTLAAAANEVIERLSELHGVSQHILPASRISKVKPEFKKKIFGVLKKPQNFFKHADIDESPEVVFKCELTEFFLYEASRHVTPLKLALGDSYVVYGHVFPVFYIFYYQYIVCSGDEYQTIFDFLGALVQVLPFECEDVPSSKCKKAWYAWFRGNYAKANEWIQRNPIDSDGWAKILKALETVEIEKLLEEYLSINAQTRTS